MWILTIRLVVTLEEQNIMEILMNLELKHKLPKKSVISAYNLCNFILVRVNFDMLRNAVKFLYQLKSSTIRPLTSNQVLLQK